MPAALVALLIALGCQPVQVTTPVGPALSVWVCPPIAPAPAPEAPEERPS